MLPSRSLTDLAAALSADVLIAGARRIESWRSAESEEELGRWLGLRVGGAWTTPYMLQAGRVARARGVVAFDRLERVFLPAPAAWVHPEIGPAGYGTALGHERLLAPQLWPFAQDCPVGDFQAANLPPKWLTHGLVHTLVGFGWWPGLSEWQLMHMSRLSEAAASLHWYWLSELGRMDHRGLGIDLGDLGGADAAMYTVLEEEARAPENRAARLSEETSRIIADNALEVLSYEIYAYRQGMYEGDLVEPTDRYLGFGEACEYAKTHLPRLRSAAFERFLEHAAVAGRDYATSPEGFEARAAQALAPILEGWPAAHADLRARARRTLQDVAQRLTHLEALREERFDEALTAVADAIAKLDGEGADPDGLVAAALERVLAGVPDRGEGGGRAVLALGYSPTGSAEAEPAAVREVRSRAVVRRAWATHSAFGAALEGMPAVARRIADGVRSGSLLTQAIACAEAAAQAEEIPWLGYAYLGYLQVAEYAWGSTDPASASKRWHYRLARRQVPEDRGVFAEYEVAWNPYLKRFPLPFDAKWNDELRRTRPGQAKPFKGKNTTSVWYTYLGPGREGPVYLPLVPRLAALIAALKVPRRLDELVADPDFGEAFLREAVADEAVLLFHKPRLDRPARAIDLYEVAMEAASGLDHVAEPPGPWNEVAQADAYEAFCARSGHYRESGAALCDAVGIPAEARVGELGFGTGETTRAILERLGELGRVVAVDPAPLMVERVLANPEFVGDHRARFALGGARALAWTAAHEGPFDRIVAGASVWLAQDMGEVLRLLARATVEGGRVGLSIPAEYLGRTEHVSRPEAVAVAGALEAARRDLGIPAPGPEAVAGSPERLLGDPRALVAGLEAAGWRNVELRIWERPWSAGEYLAWLALPVVAEGMCHASARHRAGELIEALRERIDPAAPLVAAWYLVTAERGPDAA